MRQHDEHVLFPPVETGCPFAALPIDRRELYLLMGYGDKEPEPFLLDVIEEILSDLKSLCDPRYGFGIYRGKRLDRTHTVVGAETFDTGVIITSTLKEADYYSLFLATIGDGFDSYVKRLQDNDDMMRAFVAHNLGSILAEGCVSLMLQALQEKADEMEVNVSNSYSVGYCDWKLVEQAKVFSFFPRGFCRVRLTESCLMLPVKSVSGIVGLGKNVKKRKYSCEMCTMKSCVKNRNKAFNKGVGKQE